jgi:hypothetical protein
VGKNGKSWIDIGILIYIRVCLEVNMDTKTLEYFMNDEHIKNRVVNITKDVYFGV